jgi:hypothetical protein
MSNDTELRGLVHDLNNAIARILTTAELVESESEPGGQVARDANAIRDAALESRDLVSELHRRLSRDA